MRWWVVTVALLLGACARDAGTPLTRWTLEVAGRAPVEVELPADLRELVGTSPYRLRCEVPLPAPGGPYSLTVTRWVTAVSLDVDGRGALALNRRAPGVRPTAHAWQVVPVGHERVELVLWAENRDAFAPIVATVPHLSATPLGDARYLAVQSYNGWANTFVLGAFATMGFVFVLSFALDRGRHADGWFALLVCSPVIIMLYQRGWLHAVVGGAADAVLAGNFAATGLVSLHYTHAYFRLGRPRRARALWAAVPAVFLVGLAGPTIARQAQLAGEVMLFGLVGVCVVRLARLVRQPEHRADARLLLAAWVWTMPLVVPESLFLVSRAIDFDVQISPIAFAGFAMVQMTVLTRNRQADARRTEALNRELRHQIAERSRELAAALTALKPSSDGPLAAGAQLAGRYRVLRSLGAGGMGAVYEVERLTDEQVLALKLLPSGGDRDRWMRLALEAHRALKVTHPNVVAVHDVGVDERAGVFLVMELVRGRSLEAARGNFGRIAWARPILAQVAAGLDAIHAAGIVHRDLKPANVLLGTSEPVTIKIADFGLAGLASGSQLELADTAVVGGLTRTGVVVGTPFYLAPELAMGSHAPRPSSDVFSFGVLAHELLTGRRPSGQALALGTLPPPLRLAEVPDDIAALLIACLHLEPERRPAASRLARELARWAG